MVAGGKRGKDDGKQNTLAPLDAAIDSEKENEDRVGK
jgi:hypothetical protein